MRLDPKLDARFAELQAQMNAMLSELAIGRTPTQAEKVLEEIQSGRNEAS
jgi:hypothetical protein